MNIKKYENTLMVAPTILQYRLQKEPTNAQGSSGCFVNTFQISYPNMFQHMVAILWGRECLISYSSNVLCYG
jgi:hypothetical protein